DVSVVGFDNAVGSDHFTPSLTTVEQDFPALGQRAIEVLIAMIGGEEVPVRPIAPSLVLRSSTAPPRQARREGAEPVRTGSYPVGGGRWRIPGSGTHCS